MRLYILASTGALIREPGNNYAPERPTIKLQTIEALEVQYVDDAGQPKRRPAGRLPYIGIKQRLHFDDVFIAISDPLIAPDTDTGFYVGVLDCRTAEFAALLGNTPGNPAAEAASVDLMAEVVCPVDDNGNLARSQTFELTGLNRVVTGDEGEPSSAGLGPAPADDSLVMTMLSGVRAWFATSAIGRALMAAADAFAARTALGLGTAATRDVGSAASQVVALDANGRLPAVDGSQLTFSTGISAAGNVTITGNHALSWGATYGFPAIYLTDSGPGARHGMGVQPFETQQFLPDDGHYSFNGGGGLNASGVNEWVRISAAGITTSGALTLSPLDDPPATPSEGATLYLVGSQLRLLYASSDDVLITEV